MSTIHTRQVRKAARKLAAGLSRLVSLQPENQKSRENRMLLKQVAYRLYQSLVRPILDSPEPQARRKKPF